MKNRGIHFDSSDSWNFIADVCWSCIVRFLFTNQILSQEESRKQHRNVPHVRQQPPSYKQLLFTCSYCNRCFQTGIRLDTSDGIPELTDGILVLFGSDGQKQASQAGFTLLESKNVLLVQYAIFHPVHFFFITYRTHNNLLILLTDSLVTLHTHKNMYIIIITIKCLANWLK